MYIFFVAFFGAHMTVHQWKGLGKIFLVQMA